MVTVIISSQSVQNFLASANHNKTRLMVIFQDNRGKTVPECIRSGFCWAKDAGMCWWQLELQCTKLWSNLHYQQTNTQIFTSQMSFLSPCEQPQSTGGSNSIPTPQFVESYFPTLSQTYVHSSILSTMSIYVALLVVIVNSFIRSRVY